MSGHNPLAFAPIPSGFADLFGGKKDDKSSSNAAAVATASSAVDPAVLAANDAENERLRKLKAGKASSLLASDISGTTAAKQLLGGA